MDDGAESLEAAGSYRGFNHELDSLRIRHDDPASGVRAEDRDERANPILYPDEVTSFLDCS
jgi:hypothetical protein